uniref:protein disulfide-isomerase n=1 Tax=Taeniopygia guttata TaxID=59729 RepID=H0ZFZ7_TAEGU
MTEKTQEPHVEDDDDELDGKLNYKPPPQKTLQELQELDKDDESLAKYKKSLLGDGPVVVDPTAPNVVVTRLTLVCDSAPGPITMDLTGDLEALKKETFVLKEGVEYRVKIHFRVNRDIVSGLKYVQHTYRTGVKVDKATFMVGSYGPRPEEYEFLTPIEEAPKGTASTTGKPILLNNIPDAEAFISGAEVAVIGFFQDPQSPEAEQFRLAAGQLPEVPFGLSSSAAVLSHYGAAENTVSLFRTVDSDRRDLDMNNREVDAKDLTRFVRTNELRLVTEYNPVTSIGVMQSSLQFNLLLITDKMSPKHPERMRKFRAAAELYKGKILFILLDSNLKSNERVLSYFQLKKSQLPALAIFHTPDDEHEVLTVGDISTERVQDFCNRFLQRMPKKEDKSEEKPLNEEL